MNIKTTKKQGVMNLKNKEEKILVDKDRLAERWRKYFQVVRRVVFHGEKKYRNNEENNLNIPNEELKKNNKKINTIDTKSMLIAKEDRIRHTNKTVGRIIEAS